MRLPLARGIALGALALSLAGCSEDAPPAPAGEAPPAAELPASESPQAPAVERRPIDPALTGTIRGVVRFEGEAPARTPINVNAAGCRHEGEVLTETVVVNDGKLQNVFVRVSAGLEAWTLPPAPETPARLDQRGCVYVPHVSGVRVGQPLQVLNSDPATHNVHARPKRPKNGADINQTQPQASPAMTLRFAEPEVMIPFSCDIHPWMRAFVGAVEHPFFAVSDAEGRFEIAGLPAGSFELEAWHEKYARKKQQVTVTAGAATEVVFTFGP